MVSSAPVISDTVQVISEPSRIEFGGSYAITTRDSVRDGKSFGDSLQSMTNKTITWFSILVCIVYSFRVLFIVFVR